MSFMFATCERDRAFRFMTMVYPDSDLTKENCKELLDYVEADKIRTPDPTFHGSAMPIVPGNNWDESERDEIIRVASKLRDHAIATKGFRKDNKYQSLEEATKQTCDALEDMTKVVDKANGGSNA